MSRRIILVRHGESADKQLGQSDFDRVLTERGTLSIQLLGRHIDNEKIQIQKIISSSAVRAKQTVELICLELNHATDQIEYERSLYNGTDADYWNVIATQPSIIVGHNPAISFVLGKILTDYSVSLLPGQAAVIEMDDNSQESVRGQLLKLIGPFTNNDVVK